MSLFQTILKQVQERLHSQEHDLEVIAEEITRITKVPVKVSQLSIKKGLLILSVPPTLKLAIIAKKETILAFCKDRSIAIHAIA